MARSNQFQRFGFGGGRPFLKNESTVQAEAGIVSGPLPGISIANLGDVVDELPPEAAARLRDLRQRRDDVSVLMRSAFEQWQDLHLEAQRHRNRIRELSGPRGAGGYDLDETDVRVADEQRRLDAKVGELARRAELREVRSARWNDMATLVTCCEGWIRQHGPTGLHPPIQPELKKGETALDAIERLRRRGRELRADLQRAQAAPWPSTIAKQRMRETISKLAAAGRPRADAAVDHNEEVGFPMRSQQVSLIGERGLGAFETVDMLGLMAWLHEDAMITALDQEIDECADDANALTAVQRAEIEAQIQADVLAVERAEAELVWQLLADGAAVMHRPDIHPAALLGLMVASSA
ncbi:hypothetical protein ACQR09_23010 [Bradyrhizobium oligotrophicum]|uniref:hypothetical protein n=1 Tax=Bradyrhizobium oligotrophicum TaxID=44255 RepID=UPI003EBF7E38